VRARRGRLLRSYLPGHYLPGQTAAHVPSETANREATARPASQARREFLEPDFAQKYAIHAGYASIGNSRTLAQEHYFQVTDAHFEQAAPLSEVLPSQQAAQNAAVSVDKRRKGHGR
jgi:hypothetical protein